MMQKRRLFALLLVLTLFITAFPLSSVPLSAAEAGTGSGGNETRYTQKFVAVVYDNSGSMRNESRIPSAKYSLSMLMSMLDERDVMQIMPMNNAPSGGIPVDLASPDREAVINSIVSNSNINTASGGTPSSSMVKAVEFLQSRGLKDTNHLIESDTSKEYWLVVLTDGLFEDKESPSYQAGKIIEAVNNFPTLHTVYVSFGSGAIDISGEKELENYPVTSYCKIPADPKMTPNLAMVMQNIANQISGRYPLSSDQYSISDKTVKVDLSEIPFSLSSLSVIAQNCGATIQDIKYENPSISKLPKVSKQKVCNIKPDSALGIKSGCSFEIVSDSYLFGGSLTLTFSDPVNPDQFSIFAEPALDITYHIESLVNSSMQKVDAQFINANLKKGDLIYVKYDVREQVNNSVIDLEKVFGDVEAKVTYGSTVYKMGDPIPLIVGTNKLSVEVSVMNGAYTLRQTEILTVEEDPSFYRIEVQGDDEITSNSTKTTAVFTVFVDNKEATKDILKDYVCTAKATKKSDGSVIFENKVIPDDNGRFSISLDVELNKFDVYDISLTVVSPQKLSRSKTHSVTYAPTSLDITVEGDDHISATQYDFKTNTKSFIFKLGTNGQPFPFINGVSEYKLTVDGVDLTKHATVTGNTLTFIPTEEVLGDLINKPGDKDVVLTLRSAKYPGLNTEAKTKLTIIKTVYTIVPLASSVTDIDRFGLKDTKAVLYFTVQRDGVSLGMDELKPIYDNGQIKISTDSLFTNPFLPANTKTSLETVDGTAVVAVKAVRDMNSYLDWHLSAFIKGGDKPVNISYGDIKCEAPFTVVPSSLFQHILRITLLVLEILYLIHLLIALYAQFFVVKALPRGVLLYISGGMTVACPINVSTIKRIGLYALWAAFRFLVPFCEFKDQALWFQKPNLSEYPLKFSRTEGLNFTPVSEDTYFKIRISEAQRTRFNNYIGTVIDGQDPDFDEYMKNALNLSDIDYSDFFIKANNIPLRMDSSYEVTGVYLGTMERNYLDELEITSFVTFVEF